MRCAPFAVPHAPNMCAHLTGQAPDSSCLRRTLAIQEHVVGYASDAILSDLRRPFGVLHVQQHKVYPAPVLLLNLPPANKGILPLGLRMHQGAMTHPCTVPPGWQAPARCTPHTSPHKTRGLWACRWQGQPPVARKLAGGVLWQGPRPARGPPGQPLLPHSQLPLPARCCSGRGVPPQPKRPEHHLTVWKAPAPSLGCCIVGVEGRVVAGACLMVLGACPH